MNFIKKKKTTRKTTKLEKAIGTCFFIFIIFEVIKKVFSSEWTFFFAKNISFFSLITGVFLLTIYGIKNLRTKGFFWKRLLIPAFSVTLSISYVILLIWGQQNMMRMVEFIDDKDGIEQADYILNKVMYRPFFEDWKNKLAPKIIYRTKGMRVLYPKNCYELELYEPPKEDVEFRKEMIQTKQNFINLVGHFRFSAIIWTFQIIISALIGLFYPVNKKKPKL